LHTIIGGMPDGHAVTPKAAFSACGACRRRHAYIMGRGGGGVVIKANAKLLLLALKYSLSKAMPIQNTQSIKIFHYKICSQ
jgi:hypothetical protein